MAMLDQQSVFNERVQRIAAGRQYEHEDIVGFRTQSAYNSRAKALSRRPPVTLRDKLMKWVALVVGAGSVLGGKLTYFHAAQIDGLPQAFYDLEHRGMALAVFLIGATLTMVLHLGAKGRMGMLILGLAAMYYGESLIALAQPDLWAGLFSPEYAASMAEAGRAILQDAG
jgi:hypothetical protein